jgi:hypothetical protein
LRSQQQYLGNGNQRLKVIHSEVYVQSVVAYSKCEFRALCCGEFIVPGEPRLEEICRVTKSAVRKLAAEAFAREAVRVMVSDEIAKPRYLDHDPFREVHCSVAS